MSHTVLLREFLGRPALIERLSEAHDRIVLITAPAGYGKTSLLGEWERADPRPFIHIDVVAGPPDWLDTLERPVVFTIDDASRCRSGTLAPWSERLLGEAPAGSALVIAARGVPDLPAARLRAYGGLLEIGRGDLALTLGEADTLLRRLGCRAGVDVLEVLIRRTGGWAAAMSLAALARSARTEAQPGDALRLQGDDHVFAQFIREEVLAALIPEQIDWLMRCSILEELSGPACDEVLARTDSSVVLAQLADTTLLLDPIDPARRRFRWHPLFRECMRGELHRLAPQLEPVLHQRASAHFAARGLRDASIEHACSARDVARAGALLTPNVVSLLAAGRAAQVLTWISAFSREQIAGSPPLAMCAAHACLVKGNVAEARHWLAVAGSARGDRDGITTPVDGAVACGLAVLEATVGRGGADEMLTAAQRARVLAAESRQWQPVCDLLEGVAAHLGGDRDGAVKLLTTAGDLAGPSAPTVTALCLAQRAMIAIELEDWAIAEELTDGIAAVTAESGLDGYPIMAIGLAATAAVRAHAGRIDEAKHDLRRGTEMLTFLGEFVPWYGAQANILLAHAALWLADIAAARTLLAQASRLARKVPDAVIFDTWFADAWSYMDSLAEASLGSTSTLTIAELRVLRFLPSHRSFREIAAQLGVSANTVKSQAHAVYRKLGAASRSEAVERASAAGLLGQ